MCKHAYKTHVLISIDFYQRLTWTAWFIQTHDWLNDDVTSGFRCKSTSEPSRGVINPHTWFFLFSTSKHSRHKDTFGDISSAECCKRCKTSNSWKCRERTERSYGAVSCAYIEWTKLSRWRCSDESCLSTASADPWRTSTWVRRSYHCEKENTVICSWKMCNNLYFLMATNRQTGRELKAPLLSQKPVPPFLTNGFQSACSTALCHSVDTFSTVRWPAEC